MSISTYLKEIGRGRDGARALSRAQATDLMAKILDNQVSDLEIGAFCLAMRVKGEIAEEMAGFLDAIAPRLHRVQVAPNARCVIIPSYNGARKLPCLTPLLAGLLAQEGFAVIVHGSATESTRVTSQNIWKELNWSIHDANTNTPVQSSQCIFVETSTLNSSLKKLLDARRVIGLRNSAHSLVKLMNPSSQTDALLMSSYTHPEYALSMAQTLALMHTRAVLLRGTEGEAVADVRRQPQMDLWTKGQRHTLAQAQSGSLTELPELPSMDAVSTAHYTQEVLQGRMPVAPPLMQQVKVTVKAFDF